VSSRKKAFLLGIIFFLSSLVLASYFILSNPDMLRQLVLQQIDEVFGQKIRIEAVDVSMFPHPQIELRNVVLGEQNGTTPFFRASRVALDIRIFPLLKDQIVPKHLLIVKPELIVRRDVLRKWVLANGDGGPLGISTLAKGFLVPAITLTQGRVTFVDEFHPQGHQTLVMEDISLGIKKGSDPVNMDLTLTGTIPQSAELGVMSLYSSIEVLPVVASFNQAPSLHQFNNIKVSGRFNLQNIQVDEVEEFFQLTSIPVSRYGVSNFQGDFTLTPGLAGFDLAFLNYQFDSQTVDFTGNANISGLFSEDLPTFFFGLSAHPIALKEIPQLFPPEALPPSLIQALEAGQLGGMLQVVKANIAGSPRPDVGVSFGGEFLLTKGNVDLGETWGRAEEIQARIVLHPDEVHIEQVTGVYDSIPVTFGKAKINLASPGLWFESSLQGEMPGPKLISILQRIFSDDDMPEFFTSTQGTSGSGQLAIRFAGPLSQPEEVQFQDASYQVTDGTLDVESLGFQLSDIEGTIDFSQRHVGFTDVHGQFGQSPFILQGAIRLEETNSFDAFHIHGQLHEDDVEHWIIRDPSLHTYIQGSAEMDMVLSGPMESPNFQSGFELNPVTLNFPNIFHKPEGVPGSLALEGRVYSTGEILFKRIDFSVLPFHLSGRATIQTKPTMVFDTSFTTDPIDLKALPKGVVLGDPMVTDGTLEMTLNLTGRGFEWKNWKKNGWFALSDGVIDNPKLDDKVEQVFLRVKFSEDIAEVKRFDFSINDSLARATGTIRHWDSQPQVTFDISSPQFDLDLLIPKGERSPIRDFLELVADSCEVKGVMRFERAWYKDLLFIPLQGNVQIHNKIVGVDQIHGTIETGEVKGRLLVYLPKNKPATVKTWVDLTNVPLEPAFSSFIPDKYQHERLMTGHVNVKGAIQGDGRDTRGTFPTLQGNFDVEILDGRIERGTVVPKILTILNLPVILQGKVDLTKKGYPFDKQSATILVHDGVFSSENIVIESPVVPMTAAGAYDLHNDQLDLIMAVSPFGSYSDLLKKIPVFGLLFEGEREAIDTALFEVKGSIHQPEVTYRPLQSFQAGLTGLAKFAINVLKNTVTLPLKLLTPSETPSSNVPAPPRSDHQELEEESAFDNP